MFRTAESSSTSNENFSITVAAHVENMQHKVEHPGSWGTVSVGEEKSLDKSHTDMAALCLRWWKSVLSSMQAAPGAVPSTA